MFKFGDNLKKLGSTITAIYAGENPIAPGHHLIYRTDVNLGLGFLETIHESHLGTLLVRA